MNNMEQLSTKWNELTEKIQPGLSTAGKCCHQTGHIIGLIGTWIWRLRKIFMAIPVVWLSVYLALLNHNMLPDTVGLNLQVTGEFEKMISKNLAVYGPLAVTGACLLMMFVSKKTLYPWLICLFSLAFPVLLLVTNVFPA